MDLRRAFFAGLCCVLGACADDGTDTGDPGTPPPAPAPAPVPAPVPGPVPTPTPPPPGLPGTACGAGGWPLAGVWCARFVDPNYGPAVVELILADDGIQFREQYVYAAGAVISIYGGYRVFQDPLGTFTLRLDTAGGDPVVDQAGNPIRYPAETYGYTLLDANTMVLNLAYIDCSAGAGACFAQCNGCDPRLFVCQLTHTRGSCNAP